MNSRPLAPQASALAGLRYAPNHKLLIKSRFCDDFKFGSNLRMIPESDTVYHKTERNVATNAIKGKLN